LKFVTLSGAPSETNFKTNATLDSLCQLVSA